MSEHERWIVYPLLFLTLGVSLRDKLTRTVTAERIECRTLVFAGRENKPLLHLTTEANLQEDAEQQADGVLMFDGEGQRLAMLGSTVQCKMLAVEETLECKALVARGPVSCALLQSHEMHVVGKGDPAARLVSLGSVPTGSEGERPRWSGRITVQGADGRPVVAVGSDETGAAGIVTTQTSAGRSQAALRSTSEGGLLAVTGGELQLTLALGHFPQESGLVAAGGDGNLLDWLPVLKRAAAETETEKNDD